MIIKIPAYDAAVSTESSREFDILVEYPAEKNKN